MERKFMKGCEAVAEAAVRAGCRSSPATPSPLKTRFPSILPADCPKLAASLSRVNLKLPPSTWLWAPLPPVSRP